MKFFALGDEILAATHRWPVIVTAFLLGSLLGGLGASIWPSPHRAMAEIFVGLDPFRALEDRYVGAYTNLEFRFPDDYKFWQMSQLNALAVSDEYLGETLARLREQNSSWNDLDVPLLRGMLQVHWRDPGIWQLVADNRDALLAEQAVATWRQVIVERAGRAISRSQSLFLLDQEIQAVSAQIVQTRQREAELEETRSDLLSWGENHLGGAENDRLTSDERSQLVSFTGKITGLQSSLQPLLSEIPPAGAGRGEYSSWIEQLEQGIHQEIENARTRLEILEGERAALAAEWESALHDGRGLAATLTIEKIPDDPRVSQVSSTALAALVGGILGLLAWGFGMLVLLNNRGVKER